MVEVSTKYLEIASDELLSDCLGEDLETLTLAALSDAMDTGVDVTCTALSDTVDTGDSLCKTREEV